jgi:hypothetical protein
LLTGCTTSGRQVTALGSLRLGELVDDIFGDVFASHGLGAQVVFGRKRSHVEVGGQVFLDCKEGIENLMVTWWECLLGCTGNLVWLEDGRWEMGDGRWEMGDGRNVPSYR